MTKLNFILSLNEKLSGLPQNDIEEHLRFYTEMIEDRMEEGLSEEEAVLAVGSVDEIAEQILAEASSAPSGKSVGKPKARMKTWELLLLILGFPVWFPILIAAAAVLFSLYVSLWSLVVSLWAVFASVGGCAIAGILVGIGFFWGSSNLAGFAVIGACVLCAGLSFFLLVSSKVATKGMILLTKKAAISIKNQFTKREEV